MKQNYTILFFFFSSFWLLISCESKNERQVQEQLEKAIEIGELSPNQALLILDSIQMNKKLDKRSFMLYQIAVVKAKRNANLDIDKKQAGLIAEAVEYFEEEKDLKHVVLANYYTGIAYQRNNDYEKGYTYFLKTYPYAEMQKDSTMMGKILYNVGSIYFDQQLYDSSSVSFKKAIPLLKDYPEYQVQAYRLVGSNYYLAKDYNTALKYLNRGFFILKKNRYKQYTYLYNTLYGIILKDLKRYDEAAIYLRKNLEKGISITEQLRAALNLTDIFTLSQNIDSASYYVQEKVIPLLLKFRVTNLDDDFMKLFGYRVLQDYYIEQGNKAKIKEYVNLHIQKEVKINNQNMDQHLLEISKTMTIQRAELIKKQSDIKLILYTFLLCVLFLTVIPIIIYIIAKKD